MISFTSSIHSLQSDTRSTSRRREDIDSKIECVEAMVALVGCRDVDLWSRKVEAMSATPANCEIMRANRTVDAVVQVLHGARISPEDGGAGDDDRRRNSRQVRLRMANSLRSMVHAHPTDKQCKREARVLRLLETLRMYADLLRDVGASAADVRQALGRHGCRPVRLRLPAAARGAAGPPQAAALPDAVSVVCGESHYHPIPISLPGRFFVGGQSPPPPSGPLPTISSRTSLRRGKGESCGQGQRLM